MTCSDDKDHRKRVKHPSKPGVARELTFSCYQRRPLLNEDPPRLLLSDAIDRAVPRHGVSLIAFVFMPEHVHLLVYPQHEDADVSHLLQAIKKPHAFRVKSWMRERGDGRLRQLTIRERPNRTVFRFWQEGSGYDRDVFSGGYLQNTMEYCHANPVRRGLCDRPGEWRWSSWHHYFADRVPGELSTVHGTSGPARRCDDAG